MGSGFLLEAQIPPDCRFYRGSWTSKTPMPESRSLMASCVIDGIIYATCGTYIYAPEGYPWKYYYKRTLFTYDPASDTWDSTRTPIPQIRSFPGSAQTVVDGKWYVAGGTEWIEIGGGDWVATPLARVDVYDPQTDSWETGTNLPEPIGGAGTCTLDGKIYTTGGVTHTETDYILHKTVYMYDPELDEWQSRADMNSARGGHAALVYEGKIYVLGGNDTGSDAEVYDPEQDLWTPLASMPQNVSLAGSCVLNNAMYLFGGNTGSTGTPYIQKYLPDEDRWSMYGIMPDAMHKQVLHAIGEKVYQFGGERMSLRGSSPDVDEFELSKLVLEETLPAREIPKGKSDSLDLSEYFSHMEEEPITYTVCLGTAGVVSDSLDGSMLVLSGLEIDTVEVHVRVESGIDAYGSHFSVYVTPGVSVEEATADQFKLFPNPAGDILNVQMQKDGPYDYRIYTASGRLVAEGILEGTSQSINISTLNKGMYFLKVNSPKLAITRKFIKLW